MSDEYEFEIELPLGSHRRRCRIRVRDRDRRIVTTASADLTDAAARRKVARQLAARLGGDPDKLERLLDERHAAALTDAEEAPPEEADAEVEPRYHDADGYLVLVRPSQHGEVTIPLATWTGRITEQTVIDDGAERRVMLAIEGKLADGTPLPRSQVAADQFCWMRWPVSAWGMRAVVHAGAGIADHLRVAIQLLSGDPPTSTIYGSTGWREIGGEWVYLHAGGGVAAAGPIEGVEVSLPDALAGYALPAPPDGEALAAAIRASLAVLDLAPDHITAALLGAVYRGVLAPADYALHLCGPTGQGKTELAALAQQHHGAGLDARHLPGSWASTGNSLESLAFAAADALLVVDDFAPGGSTADVARTHREADRLLRAQGNRSGRGRCRTDGTVRPARMPRGTILSTGEDVPRGQSLRARLLVLELAPGELDWQRLTACQRDAAAGLCAAALAGYVRWLAPRYPAIRAGLAAETAAVRECIHAEGTHARTPGSIAHLAVGWRYWRAYAVDAGAITQEESAELDRRVWQALLDAAGRQAEHVAVAEPCGHYLRLLAAALASGRAHVAALDGSAPCISGVNGVAPSGRDSPHGPASRTTPAPWGWRQVEVGAGQNTRFEWQPQGRRIGWLDGADLLIQPDAAYAAAQQLAHEQGNSLAVAEHTLRRRLHERELLVTIGSRSGRVQLTIRRVVEGARREVLHLRADTVYLAHTPTPATPSDAAPGGNGVVAGGSDSPEKGSLPHGLPHASTPFPPGASRTGRVDGVDGVEPCARDGSKGDDDSEGRRTLWDDAGPG
jgi:hypothetical protein